MFPLYPEASKAVTYGRNRPKPLSSTTEFKRTVKTSTTSSCSTPPSARPEVSLISKKTYFAIKMADSQRRCSQWSDDNLKWSFYKKFKIHKICLIFLVPGQRSDLNYGGRPPCHTQIDLMGWDISSVEGQMGKESSCTGGSGSRVTLSDVASSKRHVVLIIFNLNGEKTIICDIKC